ncbi:MAG: PEP-CTERM sorting domain-containing protein [Armatimonadetes bacterium]|nr:PEP-CTERM sorting domain-containing protein [Armatimonadota bacterium]
MKIAFRAAFSALSLTIVSSAFAGTDIAYLQNSDFGILGLDGYLTQFKADLVNDGNNVHAISDVTAGSLSGVNTVYLQLTNTGNQYPLTSGQLAALSAFNAGGGRVIFQLENYLWSGMGNSLFADLGLDMTQDTSGGIAFNGQVTFGDPSNYYLHHPNGDVNSFNCQWASGVVSINDSRVFSLADMNIAANGGGGYTSVLPALKRNALGAGSGEMFFLMDVNGMSAGTSADQYLLYRNIFEGADNNAAVPEPASMAALGLGIAALARKRRKLA